MSCYAVIVQGYRITPTKSLSQLLEDFLHGRPLINPEIQRQLEKTMLAIFVRLLSAGTMLPTRLFKCL